MPIAAEPTGPSSNARSPSRRVEESLRTRTLRGILWNFGNAGGGFVFQILRSIVLARLVGLEDVGLVGIATGACFLLGVLTEIGLSTALIQARELGKRCAESAFWLQVMIATAVVAMAAAGSPLVSTFFGDPRLGPIFCVLSIGFLVNAVMAIPISLLQRQMRFREANLMQGFGRLGSFAMAVPMAWMGMGYWALVVPDVLSRLATLPYFFWVLSWWPRPTLDWSALRPILGFSTQTFFNRIVAAFNVNIDYVILGRFFPIDVFGLYFFGYQRVRGPLRTAVASVRSAMLPALSRKHDDPDAPLKAFRQAVPILALVIFPCVTLGILLAGQAVPLAFGRKWADSACYFQWFLLWGYLVPVNLVVMTGYTARGKFLVAQVEGVTRAIGLSGGLLLLVGHGASIHACARWVVGTEFAGNLAVTLLGMRYLQIGPAELWTTLKGSTLACMAMVVGDALYWGWLSNPAFFDHWIWLLVRAAQAGLLWLGAITWFDRTMSARVRDLVADVAPASARRWLTSDRLAPRGGT